MDDNNLIQKIDALENEEKKIDEKKLLDEFKNSIMGSCISIIDQMRKDLDPNNLAIDMVEKFVSLQKNGNKPIEEMLLYEVYALQAIFEKAATNLARFEYMDTHVSWAAIALKAQNQIRQTLATLADVRNPRRISFITQQATAMQVNFQNENLKNELERGVNHEALDPGRTLKTIPAKSSVETMDEINWAEDYGRKGQKQIKLI